MTEEKTFFIFTTGCKANQWDSHVLAAGLREAGLTPAPAHRADFIVINACSLTGRAETDARQFIRRARRINCGAKVALVGCHAQAYPDRAFGADLVLGQGEKFDLHRYFTERGRFVAGTREFVMEKAPEEGTGTERTRFFFKIQDGCNRFCTYCVVPYARGKARSRPAGEIAATMGMLRERGVKEVVLTGIDIAAYYDPVLGGGLKELLLLLEDLDTPPRLRLSSIDPGYLDDGLIALLARSPKLAKSIHIPVQSGSDRILKSMGRRYDAASIRDLVEKLTSTVETIGIGIDLMAGFPGEDEEAFNETHALAEALDISYLHVFPYSEREGTRAAAFEGKVEEGVKKERVRRLRQVDAKKRAAFARRHLGKRVLIIPEAKLYGGRLMRGFTDNYLPVYIPYEKMLENNLVEVTIRGMEGLRLMGG
jgi:threonylcarbamoyladenosine tRNA methylthiotransferase MtaB